MRVRLELMDLEVRHSSQEQRKRWVRDEQVAPVRRSSVQRGRFQFGHGGLRRLGEAIFVFGLERAQYQFGEQRQVSNVGVVESERPGGECFEDSDYAAASAQRDRDHGARSQFAAGFEVDARIGFGVVAANGLRGAKASAGKRRVAVNARADVGANRARRGAQNDLVIFGERDGQTIRAGDCDGAFGD